MVIESTASFPTPSHPNILSTIVVPPRREPIDKASNVTIVSIEALSTLPQRTTLPLTPRAFAPMT